MIVIVIITIAIFLYIHSKRSNVLNVHSGVGNGGGDSSNIKLSGLKSDKERILILKEMKYRGSDLESKGGGRLMISYLLNMRLLVVVRAARLRVIQLTPQ